MGWLPASISTHNDRLLGRLDGEAVGLDWGAGSGELSLLVLTLDLERSALGDRVEHSSSSRSCEAGSGS